MTVFVADDSSILRERMVGMLSEIYAVEIVGEARDGVESVDKILAIQPDVIILDIRMPKRNGIDVLRQVRQGSPETTIIMLTNYPYPQYQTKCIEEGAEYFFNKYTDFEKVVELIGQMSIESFDDFDSPPAES